MKRVWVLALCLFFFGCSGAATQEVSPSVEPVPPPSSASNQEPGIQEEQPFYTLNGTPYQYGRSFLSAAGRQTYDQIYQAAAAHRFDEKIPLGPDVTDDEVLTLLSYLADDNPILWWFDPVVDLAARTVAITPRQGLTASEVLQRQELVDRNALVLLRDLDNEGDPAGMAAEIYDRLAVHMAYNINIGATDINNIYGGLVNRAGICDGYSKSYQYLLQIKGIDSIFLRGETERGLAHSWNAVCLNGSWYYADLTWGDKENLRHDYAFISQGENLLEHFPDLLQYPQLPETGDTTCDYYIYNGYAVFYDNTAPLAEQMAQAFAKQLDDRVTRPDGGAVFLEIKVIGDTNQFPAAKTVFIESLFDILDLMERQLAQSRPDLRLVRDNTISCNSNDTMHILTLFPVVDEA